MDDPETEACKDDVRAELRKEAEELLSVIPQEHRSNSTGSLPSNAMKDALEYIK